MKLQMGRKTYTIGRNDRCFCRSGQKFKWCCMQDMDKDYSYLRTPVLRRRLKRGPKIQKDVHV
jgi:hypothetical protein